MLFVSGELGNGLSEDLVKLRSQKVELSIQFCQVLSGLLIGCFEYEFVLTFMIDKIFELIV